MLKSRESTLRYLKLAITIYLLRTHGEINCCATQTRTIFKEKHAFTSLLPTERIRVSEGEVLVLERVGRWRKLACSRAWRAAISALIRMICCLCWNCWVIVPAYRRSARYSPRKGHCNACTHGMCEKQDDLASPITLSLRADNCPLSRDLARLNRSRAQLPSSCPETAFLWISTRFPYYSDSAKEKSSSFLPPLNLRSLSRMTQRNHRHRKTTFSELSPTVTTTFSILLWMKWDLMSRKISLQFSQAL